MQEVTFTVKMQMKDKEQADEFVNYLSKASQKFLKEEKHRSSVYFGYHALDSNFKHGIQ